MPLILKNAQHFDYKNNQFNVSHILVEEGKKGTLQFNKDINVLIEGLEDVRILDCQGKLVLRSFVNGHTHSYLSLLQGHPKPVFADFMEKINKYLLPLEKGIDNEIAEAAALYTAMESVKCGVTCVMDYLASPFAINGSLQSLVKAYDKIGINCIPAIEISDKHGFAKADELIEYSDSFLQNNQGLIGLGHLFTIGTSTLNEVEKLVDKHRTGVHIHFSEIPYDQEYSLNKYGVSITDRLNRHHVLRSKKNILAHSIHLSNEEAELISESGSYVCQNPESNALNKVGYFNSEGLSKIMFGTDGMHFDVLRSAKAAYIFGQDYDTITAIDAVKRLRTANDYLCSNKWGVENENNLVIFDYPNTLELNSENVAYQLITAIDSRYITHVIANGKLIVENGKVSGINEVEIMYHVREMSKKLMKNLNF